MVTILVTRSVTHSTTGIVRLGRRVVGSGCPQGPLVRFRIEHGNLRQCFQGPGGTWETWIGRRGDVARALFYMDVPLILVSALQPTASSAILFDQSSGSGRGTIHFESSISQQKEDESCTGEPFRLSVRSSSWAG